MMYTEDAPSHGDRMKYIVRGPWERPTEALPWIVTVRTGSVIKVFRFVTKAKAEQFISELPSHERIAK